VKRALLGGVGVSVLLIVSAWGPAAAAADRPDKTRAPRAPPPPAAYNWSGFYTGLNVGGAGGSFDAKTSTAPGTYLTDPADIAAINAAGVQNIKPVGFTGSVQAGYNWQSGPWVAGVEADYNYLHLKGAASSGAVLYPHGPGFGFVIGGTYYPINQFVVSSYGDADWLATLRPRIGFAHDNWLFYATGGVALTQLNEDLLFTDGAATIGTLTNQAARINDELKLGYVVGGGVEAGITDRLSLKAEYLHVNFSNTGAPQTANSLPTVLAGFPMNSSQGFSQSGSLSADIVRVGMNYKLSDPGPAAASGELPLKAPIVPAWNKSEWEFDAGSRTWWSSGSDGVPQPLYNTPQILASRIDFKDLDALSGETYARIDHASGLFVKGFLGAGRIYKGQLYDEDFPGDIAYSDTLSSGSGSLGYANIDLGYSFLRAPGAKVGAFVGYNYYTQHINAYGCTQLAGDDVCQPAGSFPQNFLAVAEDDAFNSLRVGLSSEFMLTDQLKFTGDAAYLPWTSFRSQDDHNSRQLLLPTEASGSDGVMLEGVLGYNVTNHWNVGVGARYWAFNTKIGTTTFDFLGYSGPPPVAPAGVTAERYGVFLQSGYHWGDTTPAGGGGAPVRASAGAAGPMDWTGIYLGGHLGGGWSDAQWSDPFGSAPSGFGGTNIAGFGDETHATGPLGGGQIGANWQIGHLVLGIEGAASAADLRGDDTCFSGLGGINCEHVVNAIATVTGRAGFAWDRSLVYAKAGAAWANTTYNLNGNTFNVTLGTGSANVTTSGWVAGVGLEYALTNHWTTSFEYDHVGLGSVIVPFPTVATINSQIIGVAQSIDTIKLGLNYKFDWGAPILASN
jgi:opacity protein-like surface antigen